jgi:A/G-specific adenine glycosylase
LAQGVVAGPGTLPRDAAELARLPGVGPYTAAAVASLAFGQTVPVVDGNVLRVGSRVMALAEAPRSAGGRRALEGWVRSLLDGGQPGRVNEALMELGAAVCAPRSPRCGECPLAVGCRALQLGRPEAFPPPRRARPIEDHRWVAACAVEPGERWLLKRVTEGPILRGLWLPPFRDLEQGEDPVVSALALLPVQHDAAARQIGWVEHGITHRRITVVPVVVRVGGGTLPGSDWRWFDVEEKEVATSSLLRKLVDAVAGSG